MVREGYEPVLKKKRWCLLKRPQNLTDKQRLSLRVPLGYNLKSVRAYLLKEEFQLFWQYDSVAWAAKFLAAWCQLLVGIILITSLSLISKRLRMVPRRFQSVVEVVVDAPINLEALITASMLKEHACRSQLCIFALYSMRYPASMVRMVVEPFSAAAKTGMSND